MILSIPRSVPRPTPSRPPPPPSASRPPPLPAKRPPADPASAISAAIDELERAVPCRAALAHLYDDAQRDFVVIAARGERSDCMLLTRCASQDPLLRVAMPTGQPFEWNDLRNAPVSRLARFASLARVERVMVCPVVSGRRWLGAIELVDPRSGRPFDSDAVSSGRAVVERLAIKLASFGARIDVGSIARAARTA